MRKRKQKFYASDYCHPTGVYIRWHIKKVCASPWNGGSFPEQMK